MLLVKQPPSWDIHNGSAKKKRNPKRSTPRCSTPGDGHGVDLHVVEDLLRGQLSKEVVVARERDEEHQGGSRKPQFIA